MNETMNTRMNECRPESATERVTKLTAEEDADIAVAARRPVERADEPPK
jgi:hypothetical protein